MESAGIQRGLFAGPVIVAIAGNDGGELRQVSSSAAKKNRNGLRRARWCCSRPFEIALTIAPSAWRRRGQ